MFYLVLFKIVLIIFFDFLGGILFRNIKIIVISTSVFFNWSELFFGDILMLIFFNNFL